MQVCHLAWKQVALRAAFVDAYSGLSGSKMRVLASFRRQWLLCLPLGALVLLGCEHRSQREVEAAAAPEVTAPSSLAQAGDAAVEPERAAIGDSRNAAGDETAGETGAAELTEAGDNDAEQLLASADRIRVVELVDPASKDALGRLDDAQRRRFSQALAGGSVSDSYVAGPAPFGIALRIFVEGREQPFIAHPAGTEHLRVNPDEPWSRRPEPPARDIHVGLELLELLDANTDQVIDKAYRLPDNIPLPGQP